MGQTMGAPSAATCVSTVRPAAYLDRAAVAGYQRHRYRCGPRCHGRGLEAGARRPAGSLRALFAATSVALQILSRYIPSGLVNWVTLLCSPIWHHVHGEGAVVGSRRKSRRSFVAFAIRSSNQLRERAPAAAARKICARDIRPLKLGRGHWPPIWPKRSWSQFRES